MTNLSPHVDVPQRRECQTAFRRGCDQYPWLRVEHRGTGSHTGKDTSWAGAYDTYELSDPLSPDFGMTGRVAEAANDVAARVAIAAHGNRDSGQ